MGKKIATCSYCGTRSVLVFDQQRHELICGACGAPLHDMKFMPQSSEKKSKNKADGKPQLKQPKPSKPKDHGPAASRFGLAGHAVSLLRERKGRKSKKRKPMFRRVLEEVWDEIEDIFD